MGLDVPFDELASELGYRTLDRQPTEVIKVAPAKGDGLAGPQAAVGQYEQERSPPRPHGIGEKLHLLGGERLPGLAGPLVPQIAAGYAGIDGERLPTGATVRTVSALGDRRNDRDVTVGMWPGLPDVM